MSKKKGKSGYFVIDEGSLKIAGGTLREAIKYLEEQAKDAMDETELAIKDGGIIAIKGKALKVNIKKIEIALEDK